MIGYRTLVSILLRVGVEGDLGSCSNRLCLLLDVVEFSEQTLDSDLQKSNIRYSIRWLPYTLHEATTNSLNAALYCGPSCNESIIRHIEPYYSIPQVP